MIVGTGNLEQKLRYYVKENSLEKTVIFAGFRKDIVNAFNSMDVFCLPSESEGLPLVVIEAMSSELPVICSDIDSHRRIILDKKEGLIFPVNNIKRLSELIKKVYDNRHMVHKLGINAREMVIKEFDFKESLIRLEKLIQKIGGIND